jgi:AraC-like DNA-binding protein
MRTTEATSRTRARLLEGEPIADVAVGVGFYDQAHLSEHFRRHVGTTPGRYATGRMS